MSEKGKQVKLSLRTYERLVSKGKFGDTFDTIVSRLLEQNEDTGLGVPDIKK